MWETTTSDVPGGRKYRILEDGRELSFRRVFELLRSSEEFVDWYSDTLAQYAVTAFYWEFPPLTISMIDNASEFVLIKAPLLAGLTPDPGPFAARLDEQPGEDIVVFPNLGGDATLIVPCPRGTVDAFPHLAAFLRKGGRDQVRALWRITAETVLDRIGDTPIWLSTAGLGVIWLHLRLDSRPKYYSYRAYAERDPVDTSA